MRRLVWAMALTILLLPVMVGSQALLSDSPLQNSAPPSPVGSGARAMGVGGAFIAIADDATAANWNPGGLVQLLKPELSVVFTSDRRRVAGDNTSYGQINHLSIVYPFAIADTNIVTALTYQPRYDFNYKNNFSTHKPPLRTIEVIDAGVGFMNDTSWMYNETNRVNKKILGSLSAISPSIAVQITPALSIGFTYNFWSDDFFGQQGYTYRNDSQSKSNTTYDQTDWIDVDGDCRCNGGQICTDGQMVDNPGCLDPNIDLRPNGTVHNTLGPQTSSFHDEQTINFKGQNFNAGLLWKISSRFHFGVVYRSEFTSSIVRHVYRETTDNTGTLTIMRHTYWEEMRLPASYGVGFAFRYSDNLSFMFDATRNEWHRFMLQPAHGRAISPVNGLYLSHADVSDTMTYRVGAEYLIIQPKYAVPIRAGFFYDPEPARHKPDDYWGVAAGTGIVYEPLVLDVAYWYRWGNDVVLATKLRQNPATLNVKPKEQKGDINRQMLMVSAVLHLK